jgi:hypothetical protein
MYRLLEENYALREVVSFPAGVPRSCQSSMYNRHPAVLEERNQPASNAVV